MPDPTTNLALYLLPGMKAEIFTDGLYFAAFGKRSILTSLGENIETSTLQNGFAVEDPDTGDIVEVSSDMAAVTYLHKKFNSNKIYFFARTGEMASVDIISVPIHDHSSIVTGGPAFGTYFTDDETLGGS